MFSPDGTKVVIASADNTARVWDALTGEPISPPLQHAALAFRAAFSPDGEQVVTASKDKTAQLWDAMIGKPIGKPLRNRGATRSAAFSAQALPPLSAGPCAEGRDPKEGRLKMARVNEPLQPKNR